MPRGKEPIEDDLCWSSVVCKNICCSAHGERSLSAERKRCAAFEEFFSALVQDTPAISLDGVLAVNATAWNVFHLSIATACRKVGDKNA